MSDQQTEALRRQAATGDLQAAASALRARVRADDDAAPPWDCSWCGRHGDQVELACAGDGVTKLPCRSEGPYHDCSRCHGTGRTPWPWPKRLSLMAYAGDAAARVLEVGRLTCTDSSCLTPGLHGHNMPDWAPVPSDLADWLKGLAHWPGADLCAALAAGWAWLAGLEASDSLQWTGYGYVRTVADPVRNSLLSVAVAAVRPARRALTIASDHMRCGCSASLEAWGESCHAMHPLQLRTQNLVWVPHPETDRSNLAAPARIGIVAQHLGPERTRAIVSATLVAWADRGMVPS